MMMKTNQDAEDICPHFGKCGGCDYPQNAYWCSFLDKKEKFLQFVSQYSINPSQIIFIPSAQPYFYRHKVELKFDRYFYPSPPTQDVPRSTVIGFHYSRKWNATLDLMHCYLFAPWVRECLEMIRKWYRFHHYQSYHQREKTGSLKYLVLREGKRTGQKLLILLTTHQGIDTQDLVQNCLRFLPFQGIVYGIVDPSRDVAITDHYSVLYGEPWIEETLIIPDPYQNRTIRYRIPAFGFFQNNPFTVELLYGLLRRYVREIQPTTVYDLYGGSGGIALSIADLVSRVVCIDSFSPSISAGIENARINQINNIDFYVAKIEEWLPKEAASSLVASRDLFILDPPRSGLHPLVIRELLNIAPQCILYVSCNPLQFFREWNLFQLRYKIQELYFFDLFPFTRHAEVVAVLQLR